ncbi:unnamed protein product [Spirodela intermedia]|uniref:Amine oxidase domain-containing protein n=2 Tax=Spirodela intermedia TaxID=51605 RepID=A0A7I8IN26_SPIIN|nr:unnamed protein product [Spirodela intermedia]CAA6659180.1 unnamed protein product [Spirodela intermedia]CAA7395498.1 unnamed protein product [Spirodela intermedia]
MLRAALLTILLVAFEGHGVMARSKPGPTVIIVGAGMSGISAAKTLSEAGIKNLLILEATGRIGGRIHKTEFAGVNVETGASWVEGVNGQELNPIWNLARKLKLRTFFSDFENISANVYQQVNGLYDATVVQAALDRAVNVSKAAAVFSEALPPSGLEDISVLTFQRLQKHVPSTALDMVIDYSNHDGEFGEPPRVTSLQNTEPIPTFTNFGEDLYQVADPRGYESVVHELAHQFLGFDAKGTITDPRIKLNKVVNRIEYSRSGVIVETEDGSTYKSDYVMVSTSIGVLQTSLIKFEPDLPTWKILAIYQFSMAVYTRIFLKFPYKFWPSGNGTEYFLYASDRRGYYPIWQHVEYEYPGSNILIVTVSDEESRRIEQQPDSTTKDETMEVLRNMFGENIPEPTDILVPRWWSNRFYRGTYSNWPIGVSRYEFDQIRAPVGRVYFTGEHTSQPYSGYVHGAYLAGIDSALMMVGCIKYGSCDVQIEPKA